MLAAFRVRCAVVTESSQIARPVPSVGRMSNTKPSFVTTSASSGALASVTTNRKHVVKPLLDMMAAHQVRKRGQPPIAFESAQQRPTALALAQSDPGVRAQH